MKRIAIIGGGISGLTAAYELEKHRKAGAPIDWHLYEATYRLGGIVDTTIHETPEGRFILEGGPDAWVTEKPWARDLALELGLEADLIYSNDATRKTYILIDNHLQPMPDRMRMMVPENLATLEKSPLFSDTARAAYAAEITRAEELRVSAPNADESVSSFVRRHFGDEVLAKIGAPLLSGVFGGDVEKLSVRAVMSAFVTMEREHGSLILALQDKAATRGNNPPQPIFTTLRNGLGSLINALVATLSAERVHRNTKVEHLWGDPRWQLIFDDPTFRPDEKPHPHVVDRFDHIIFAAPLDSSRPLLAAADYDLRIDKSLPTNASSATLATFCWAAETARTFTLPPGFGFLKPQTLALDPLQHPPSKRWALNPKPSPLNPGPSLLAATFVDQKFPHRAPAGARILRAFFGSNSTEAFAHTPDAEVAAAAFTQLQSILGPLPAPDPTLTTVRRWPRSLPQYEVGHLDRMKELDSQLSRIPGLHLLGNSYRGVGLPDLIRDARALARTLAADAN